MRRKHWAAFEEFAQQHGDALVRLSFALCGDRGKAEDATQEALSRLRSPRAVERASRNRVTVWYMS